ncbi:hypothetical protein Aph01nite_66700 [Acrocarpospora phusangensis]|uniref:Uncharacterized protein n=1 Tax=Acrocarpospora phusangensis TaxID=1070424 RepID=A0A919QL93_9ACTN|nr:hypothetical protein Aph01nite_66700 [Acrocarpospora phusangensis]
MSSLAAGAGFGAATSLVNAISHSYADLESSAYTTSGWSVAEIMSVLLDSGWAWAGLAVAVGWLVTRPGERGAAALTHGAAAGVLALIAAVAVYGAVDIIRNDAPIAWYLPEAIVWWISSVILGGPLGAVGACARQPGVLGLLARLTVPVGATVQMILLPPGRNEVVRVIGQTVVWTAAAVSIGIVVVHYLFATRRRRSESADRPASTSTKHSST